MKSIKYLDSQLLVIQTKSGKSISNKATDIEKRAFFQENLCDLLIENDEEIEYQIMIWFRKINKIDFDYSIEVLNKLIQSKNNTMKVLAIEVAGSNYFEKCSDSIRAELNNKTKINRYSGLQWDDFESNEFDVLYSTKNISELAKEALKLIESKNNNTNNSSLST
ncbi:hypothetical protein [Aquimarina rhabdastrellae]